MSAPARQVTRLTATILVLLLATLPAGLTAGCRPKPGSPFDPAAYETPAAEAVLHRVLKDTAEERKEAKVGVIVLGESLKDSTPGFREKFRDTGLQWFSSQALATVWVGPVARVVERSTQLQPLQLQVLAVSTRNDGAQEVIAAWAFEDRMRRQRYLAKPAPDGRWDIQPLDVIEQKGKANE